MASKKAPAAKAQTAPAVEPPPVEVAESDDAKVFKVFDDILRMIAGGSSLWRASASKLPGIDPARVRMIIHRHPDLLSRWNAIREYRADYWFESACDSAFALRTDTDHNGNAKHKEAAEIALKIAAKLDPANYGDKSSVAHTGANGGAIESVVTLTPGEAYRKMLGGVV